MSGLPDGWRRVPLASLAQVCLGKMLDKKRKSGVPLPYLRNINVRWGYVDLSDLLTMPFQEHELERFALCDGDVLVCEGGEPGRAAVWSDVASDIKFQKALHRVRLNGQVEPRWLVHQLFLDAHRGGLSSHLTGTTIRHFTGESIKTYEVVVPPLPTQQHILAAIESHFSRLDAATATLQRVQRNLERYRASVLKAAVEGRLVPTEAELARKEGRSYEPASVLLKRILAERRCRWEEAELARLKAKGKPPTGDRWKARYEEPATPDSDGLPELPEGWCWATADQLAWSIRNGCSIAPREKDGVRILRISAVRPLACDLNDVRFLPGPAGNYEEFLVQPGDLLFTRYNGTRSLVGVCALVQHLPAPTVHPDKLIRVQLLPGCDAGFVELATNVGASRRHVESRTRTTAGQAGVSGADIKSLPVPLPPAAEQARIREASDELLTVASSVSATVLASLARSARTRQSILKWAFEGRLVEN